MTDPIVAVFGHEWIWHGHWIDLWSLPHLIFGMTIGYLALRFWMDKPKLGYWFGFSVASVLGVLWEVFERLTGLSKTEYFTNSLTDILTAMVGYCFGVWLFAKMQPKYRTLIIAFGVVIFAVLCFIGYYLWTLGVTY